MPASDRVLRYIVCSTLCVDLKDINKLSQGELGDEETELLGIQKVR